MGASSVTGVGMGSAENKQPKRHSIQYNIVAMGSGTMNENGGFEVDLEDWEIDLSKGNVQFFTTANGCINCGQEDMQYRSATFNGYNMGVRHGDETSIMGLVFFIGQVGTNFNWMVVQTA